MGGALRFGVDADWYVLMCVFISLLDFSQVMLGFICWMCVCHLCDWCVCLLCVCGTCSPVCVVYLSVCCLCGWVLVMSEVGRMWPCLLFWIFCFILTRWYVIGMWIVCFWYSVRQMWYLCSLCWRVCRFVCCFCVFVVRLGIQSRRFSWLVGGHKVSPCRIR